MSLLINATPLYNFLRYCQGSELEKKILDCGAGGALPPLALFHEFGYEVCGVENSLDQIHKAETFSKKNNMTLNLLHADMVQLPFEKESFSFVYSYNTSIHIPKDSFKIAMDNMKDVLRVNGLLYVNFLNKECDSYGIGEERSEGEFYDAASDALFVHYDEDEIEKLISGLEVVHFEKRIVNRKLQKEYLKSGYLEYIFKKTR
ncbi:MAG: class I SAM-dependent methyltransferase [Clostridia bacterium]|nr:class I SAM-dependent methyltransferase [Clostridia bacterium]